MQYCRMTGPSDLRQNPTISQCQNSINVVCTCDIQYVNITWRKMLILPIDLSRFASSSTNIDLTLGTQMLHCTMNLYYDDLCWVCSVRKAVYTSGGKKTVDSFLPYLCVRCFSHSATTMRECSTVLYKTTISSNQCYLSMSTSRVLNTAMPC